MIKRPVFEVYDDYIYDYDTNNSSFISTAALLHKKGLENHSFCLKLYDEDLQGVDPYDETLGFDMQLKIIMECKRNFFYFLREVMRIPASGGSIKFNLHRGNLAAVWSFLNGMNTYLVKHCPPYSVMI